MIIIPAIDIINGQPVRLTKGDYDTKEIVATSVIETAKQFEMDGAEYIHLVDLDGAKRGRTENAELLKEVCSTINVPIEIGGGIRKEEDIEYYLSLGVSRIILGTIAIQDRDFLTSCIQKYGPKIAVGMDCKDGYAMGQGWYEKSDLYYLDFAKDLEKIGVKTIIFTDISRDGTLSGPNLEMLENLKKNVSMDIVASGGVKDNSHIKQLAQLDLYGAIVGKAIYAKTIDLKQAIKEGKGLC